MKVSDDQKKYAKKMASDVRTLKKMAKSIAKVAQAFQEMTEAIKKIKCSNTL